jgi:thiamine monophosphate kinase
VVDLDRVPLAIGAEPDDLAFGEDYELFAAVEDPSGFTVVGSCEEGHGVELIRNGKPVVMGSWEHFR